jgi:hypothetical protein
MPTKEELELELEQLREQAAGDQNERDLCANCDHWREEHYNASKVWVGDRIGCEEYLGVPASRERRLGKVRELNEAAAARRL